VCLYSYSYREEKQDERQGMLVKGCGSPLFWIPDQVGYDGLQSSSNNGAKKTSYFHTYLSLNGLK